MNFYAVMYYPAATLLTILAFGCYQKLDNSKDARVPGVSFQVHHNSMIEMLMTFVISMQEFRLFNSVHQFVILEKC